jgi:Predicted transcriptional regulators
LTYDEAISLRITSLCNEKRITINKLATLSGITQSTLDNIIKGNSKNPNIKTLNRIAHGLGMTVSEFLDFKEINEAIFDDD